MELILLLLLALVGIVLWARRGPGSAQYKRIRLGVALLWWGVAVSLVASLLCWLGGAFTGDLGGGELTPEEKGDQELLFSIAVCLLLLAGLCFGGALTARRRLRVLQRQEQGSVAGRM